ncbi:helix-turn-helix domain-containing protein [Gordonia sp. L191]|uniref:IclR family transcriptional regulator n=1 Tax=Gordonia sp. L191 TaxID=2982699 RepID=UPI0024C034A4|nr:helix-turn-helix domain-containing protein [Gordonia sp. L191]WHU47368.1 helix-turn-helix domain-containing protein [Gordonia sp. L191]
MRRHRAIPRADHILECVARAGKPLSLSDIAREIEAPVSSTHDLVDDLRACGYLTRVGAGYRLGQRLRTLRLIAGHADQPPLTPDELTELNAVIEAPVALAVLVGSDLVYLHGVGEVPAEIGAVVRDHVPRPLLATAGGRAMLAFLPADERAALLAEHASPGDAVAFGREIDEIHACGYALSDGSVQSALRVAGVPVFDGRRLLAVVVVAAPRISDRPSPALEHAARRTAAWLAARARP